MKNSTNKTIAYFGTPDFSAQVLSDLCKTQYKPRVVITNPDAKQGRNNQLTAPPVKQTAQQHNLPILQPHGLDAEFINTIYQYQCDLFLVFAYGNILPKTLLDIPPHQALNIHGSLLPQYRGASPVQNAILNGDTTTGITLMVMDQKLDHGDILAQTSIPISPTDSCTTLLQKMVQQTTPLLCDVLPQWFNRTLTPTPQDHTRATYTATLTRENGRIQWDKPADYIERMVRAFTPFPETFFIWNNKRVKVKQCEVVQQNHTLPHGTVQVHNQTIQVACGSNMLQINELQLEGEKTKPSHIFLMAHSDIQKALLK